MTPIDARTLPDASRIEACTQIPSEPLKRTAAHRARHACLTLLALIAPAASALAEAPQQIAPAAVRADLQLAVDTIERKHPALAHSVTPAQLERAARKIARQLVRPMDRTQAWAALAQLNPVLADGHLVISLPDWRQKAAEAIREGTGFFPFEVVVEAGGYPVISASLGGAETPLAGRRIRRINGIDARIVTRSLLARVHGDTPGFRAALLSQRWWLFYSKLYGTPETFDLALDGSGGPRHVPASQTLPDILQRDSSFDRLFRCRVNTDGTARLTVSSFFWEEKQRFLQLTRDCFAQMKAAATNRLVIDVSANGGGDDDMWKDGLLRYIATRPYKQGSTYVKRERTGEVTRGSIESATVPPADEPLHYAGQVSVVIGPGTYSSAVLFSNVIKDYGFGKLTGTGGFARTSQSGGTISVILPNTGLELTYPRFVLDRPSGALKPTYLQPDPAPSLRSGSSAKKAGRVDRPELRRAASRELSA